MKICKDCNKEKSLDSFHTHSRSKKTGAIWYRGRCKKCHNFKFQPPTGKINTGRFKKGSIPVCPFKKGNVPWNKGKPWPPEMQERLRAMQLGRKQSPEQVEKRRKALTKSWDKYASYERHSAASRRWSKEVRARDNNTCQYCGKIPKRLHAHHIVSWKENKMLRHDISNGISLCIPCHKSAHKNDARVAWNKGISLSDEHRKNLSDSHKGNIPWNKGLKVLTVV